MILSIHQPAYFPWLGLLHKIAQSDVFLVMDEVQLSDSAFQHRNQFLTADGQTRYLSIPFVRKGYLDKPFREIAIAAPDWATRHRDFIRSNYGKHPFAGEIMPRLDDYFAAPYASLFDAVLASMRLAFDLLAVRAKVILQSSLDFDRGLRKGELVPALARAAGADCYLSGPGARAYLDEAAFGDGLTLRYDRFAHPVYRQKNANSFVSGLSCLDLLFNVGSEAASAILRTKADS
jgi:WbqC-like protein family